MNTLLPLLLDNGFTEGLVGNVDVEVGMIAGAAMIGLDVAGVFERGVNLFHGSNEPVDPLPARLLGLTSHCEGQGVIRLREPNGPGNAAGFEDPTCWAAISITPNGYPALGVGVITVPDLCYFLLVVLVPVGNGSGGGTFQIEVTIED